MNTPIRWLIVIAVATALSSGTLHANSVSSIVVDHSGRIYFSDYLRNRIWTIDSQGHRTILLSEKHTHHLAIDDAGNIYVANYGNRCVLKITPHGKVSVILKSSSLFWPPSGIAAVNGYVYVLESRITPPDAARIRRIAPDGGVELLASSR